MFSRLKKLLNRSERASVGNAYMEQANGHEFVDLGLSVLWASMNVGAKNIYEFGLTYKWGETKPSACSREQYKFDIRPEVDLKLSGVVYPLSKYVVYSSDSTTDYRNILESCDDAAYSNLGGSWRMPTSAEWEELFSCEWDLVAINEMIDAIRIIGKNKNEIYLPINHNGMSIARSYSESASWYWSSCLNVHNSHEAWAAAICDTGFEEVTINPKSSTPRTMYCFVRGVLDKH